MTKVKEVKVKEVFNYVQRLNAKTSTVSSMGSFVTDLNQQVSDSLRKEVMGYLSESSLAYKIVFNTDRFSEKQLWVVAFELVKSTEFCETVTNFYNEINHKQNLKVDAEKRKLAANKVASANVLTSIKSAGKKLGDYYQWLNTKGNKYRSEYFSKKYSFNSANEFLAI
jgi:hypothetical protein